MERTSCLVVYSIGIKHGFPSMYVCQIPREILKTEGVDQGFQHLPRDWQTLMYWKIMFDRCYCINSTKVLLKFGEKYGTTIWSSTSEGTLVLMFYLENQSRTKGEGWSTTNFGDFRCGALLFVLIHVIYKYKNR